MRFLRDGFPQIKKNQKANLDVQKEIKMTISILFFYARKLHPYKAHFMGLGERVNLSCPGLLKKIHALT